MSVWMVLNFLNQLSNVGTMRVLYNGMKKSWNSELHACLVHHHRLTTHVMISNGSFRSFSKYFIFNVERFAFMSRTCLKTVWHINHVMRVSKSPRSLMCLLNIVILSVFRSTFGLHLCHERVFPEWVSQEVSITLGSLWLLCKRSTSNKNTVCLLLERLPPGTNPELMVECKLIERTSDMLNELEEVTRKTTLSYNEGSTRFRPECPWRARKKTIPPESSVQYWNLLFYSSTCCQTCFPSIVRPMNRLWKLILKIIILSPEMNRSVFLWMHLLWVTKKINYFLRYLVFGEGTFPWFNVDPIPSFNGNDSWWNSQEVVLFVVQNLFDPCEILT